MQSIRAGLADELVGDLLIVHRPSVLDLQLTQLLCPCQCRLEPVYPSGEVVLRLVEDLLGLKDAENLPLLVELFLGKKEFGESFDLNLRLGALSSEKLVALGTGWLEVLDPLRCWCHCGRLGELVKQREDEEGYTRKRMGKGRSEDQSRAVLRHISFGETPSDGRVGDLTTRLPL